jgi:eukaryotic-like serine/threonine-protein kinase
MNYRNDPIDQESTVLAQPATPQLDSPPMPSMPRCRFVKGSGLHFTDEVHQLLRQRLRIACSIAFFVFAYFMIFTWGHAQTSDGPDEYDIALQRSVVALLGFLCVLFWTTYSLSHQTLRILELVMFGSMAIYFADLQFRVSYPGRIATWVETWAAAEPKEAVQQGVHRVLGLANTANNMRWFFLIVLYGMFIPNTWKRCAIVVGCIAAIPLVLMFCVCKECDKAGPYLDELLLSTVVALSIAVTMAIFGSHRISELHQQAYQARKLGQYQLQRKLGSGGMGEVYLGEHMLLKRTCAIKLIRPEQAGDPTTLSRFEREVKSMATLTHWNTVEVYDYGRTADGTFYYVMEYLPGLSLQELVDLYGPLAPGRAIHFLRQLCAALREAHSIGLIHRDIKPSNVIACQRGGVYDVAKLLDFGLVQDVGAFAAGSDKLTMIGAILGSPNYISPEQARGKGPIDPRTDIYSIGALAYFLVTGQTPFVRDTAMELLAAHMKDEVQPPHEIRPELPLDLEEVILMCLRKNPDDRFADVESLDLALAACDSSEQWDGFRARDWWQGKDKMQTSVA